MSSADAFVVSQEMPARAAEDFEVPYHYVVYAETGTMRLESGAKRWTLPPARAGLVAAGHKITVELPRPVRICSALIMPDLVPKPPALLTVFDMSALARELLFALRPIGKDTPLDPYSAQMVSALAAEIWRLCNHPTRAVLPVPESPQLRQALFLTEANLANTLTFDEVAAQVAMSPRSLARKMQGEIGMTWRDVQRRMRMIRAVELLSEGTLPITDVALAVGYSSLSAFNAAFRAFADVTPSQYRATVHRRRPY